MKLSSVLAVAALVNNYSVEQVNAVQYHNYQNKNDHSFSYYQLDPEKKPVEKKEDDNSFLQLREDPAAEAEAKGESYEPDKNDLMGKEEEEKAKLAADVAVLSAKADANKAKALKKEAEKKAAEEQAK